MAVSEKASPQTKISTENITVTRTNRRPITLDEGTEAWRKYTEEKDAQLPPIRTKEYVLAQFAKNQS